MNLKSILDQDIFTLVLIKLICLERHLMKNTIYLKLKHFQ